MLSVGVIVQCAPEFLNFSGLPVPIGNKEGNATCDRKIRTTSIAPKLLYCIFAQEQWTLVAAGTIEILFLYNLFQGNSIHLF